MGGTVPAPRPTRARRPDADQAARHCSGAAPALATAATMGTSTKDAMAESKRKSMAMLNSIEDQDPEEALRRYREQTQLNKPKDGKRVSLMDRQSSGGQQGGDAFKQSERIIRSTAAIAAQIWQNATTDLIFGRT